MKGVVYAACVALLVGSAQAEVRTWKDKSGKFSIQAELVDSDGTNVRLKKADGKIIPVAIDKLSDDDRRFLESQEKSAFGGAPAPSDAAPKTTGAPGLRYDWKAGKNYAYKVQIEVELGDTVLEMTGSPSYTVVSADKDRAVLNFRGMLTERERSKSGQVSGPSFGPRGPRGPGRMGPPRPMGPGPRMRPSFMGMHGLANGIQLTVTPQGGIARQQGRFDLPFLMGNLSHLMIEALPANKQQSWTVANDSGVLIKDEGFPTFGPYANTEGFVPAREKTVYTVESETDKLVVIRKQYEFITAATGSDKPPFEITGNGKYIFNKEEGVSGALDFSMKLTLRKGGVSVEIPLKATYHLIDEAERAAMAKAAQEAQAEAKKPLEPGALTDLVADLNSGDQMRVMKALQQLVLKTPEKPDPEIAKALEKLLTDSFMQTTAMRALEKWSIPENVPALLKALDDKSPMARNSAIKAMTRHKPQEAIEPVVGQLRDLATRRDAAEFLKAIGPPAETPVAKQLENLDPRVRREAASILKVIGTKQSVPALEKAMSDPDVFVKNDAKDALSAIKGRSQ